MKSLVGFIVAFFVGTVPAFFINLNSVFSDGNGSLNELLSIFLLIIVSYVVLGIAFGFIGKKRPMAWGITISSPAIVILALYSFVEPKSIGQSLVNIFVTLASAWIGSYLGVRLKTKKNFK